MKKSKNLEITIPHISPKQTDKHETSKQKNSNNDIVDLKASIKSQYEELMQFQDINISEKNKDNIERLLFATEDLINNCMNSNFYSGNRDENFVNLLFIYQRISLRIETYKIEEKLQILNDKNIKISQNQKNLEKQSNNLIYNILGFIASFSVVSAAVSAVDKMNSLQDIMLFMAFTAFILLTTLIALNNFYKCNHSVKKISLQNNKFLWLMMCFVIILLMGYKCIQYIKNDKTDIFEAIGRGIEQIRQSTVHNNQQP